MGFSKWYPAQEDTLRNVIPLQKYIETELFQPTSPFYPDKALQRLLRRGLVIFSRIVKRLVGREIWIENTDRELRVFSKPARNLLSRLLSQDRVTNWENGIVQSYFLCRLMAGSLNTIDDNSKHIAEANALSGFGTNANMNTALIIALAELIERVSASEWRESDLIQYSITSLKQKNIVYNAPTYIRDLTQVDEDKIIGWAYGKDLHTQAKVLLPASMLYIFYERLRDEGLFVDVTSNGVGAQTTKERALLGALYELFERDSLLMYWLLMLSPQKIDLTTFDDSEIKEGISNFVKNGCTLHLLDCRTEFNIPSLVLVIIDDATGSVDVQAAAGFNIESNVKKMLRDGSHSIKAPIVQKSTREYSKIKTMHERSVLWGSGQMRNEINFFIAGKIISLSQYKNQFLFPVGEADEIAFIKKTLEKHKSKAYQYEFKHPLANENGLHVVRAIVPNLIPMYFDESKKHDNVERLFTFSKKMGFSDHMVTKNDLNKIPHPFI